MRISDWTSDVCSSDLSQFTERVDDDTHEHVHQGDIDDQEVEQIQNVAISERVVQQHCNSSVRAKSVADRSLQAIKRSEERRVGKECVSTCRSRWSRYH